MTGAKGAGFGADDALRPALPDSPGGEESAAPWLFDTVAALIQLRREHPWWAGAGLEVLAVAHEELSYRLHTADHSAEVSLRLGVDYSARISVDGVIRFDQVWQ